MLVMMTEPTIESISSKVQSYLERSPAYFRSDDLEFLRVSTNKENRIICPILSCDKNFGSDTALNYHCLHHEHDLIEMVKQMYLGTLQSDQSEQVMHEFEYAYRNDIFPLKKQIVLYYHENKRRPTMILLGKPKDRAKSELAMGINMSIPTGTLMRSAMPSNLINLGSVGNMSPMGTTVTPMAKRRRADGVWLPIHLLGLTQDSAYDMHARKELDNRVVAYPGWRIKKQHVQLINMSSEMKAYLPSSMGRVYDLSFMSLQGEMSTPQTMNLFETMSIPYDSEGYVVNVGATVWGLDWCPQSYSGINLKENGHTEHIELLDSKKSKYQYIAIGGYRTAGESQVINESDSGKGVIQIWNMGPITDHRPIPKGPIIEASEKETLDEFPKLEILIAHESGCVWDLKWCPTNACDHPMTLFQDEDILPRLGLLAATFGDGSCKIFSVPHPELLRKWLESKEGSHLPLNEYMMIRLDPVFNALIPDVVMWNISWSMDEAHTRLATGCADGNIAIWALENTSLPFNDGIYRHIPSLFFRAHELAVRSVDFCPYNDDLLASCGHDGRLQIWDLRDPNVAILSLKMRAFLMSVKWPDGANGLFFTDGDNGCKFIHLQNVSNHDIHTKRACEHAGCVWNIAASPHHPVIATASADGTVKLTYFSERLIKSRRNKIKDVVLFQLMSKSELNTHVNASTTTASSSVYPLCFVDRLDMESITGRAPVFNREVAFQRVAWNPNTECLGWIAASNSLGFVRLQKAKFEDSV